MDTNATTLNEVIPVVSHGDSPKVDDMKDLSFTEISNQSSEILSENGSKASSINIKCIEESSVEGRELIKKAIEKELADKLYS